MIGKQRVLNAPESDDRFSRDSVPCEEAVFLLGCLVAAKK
jgi:hypothetical protein